jgi:ribonuclease HI
MEKIYIYADGGCRGNQFDTNIGGYGVYITYNGQTKELKGATRNTTNNIMELTSAIEGLKAIKKRDIPVEVVMDSQYVVQGINEWIHGWIKKGWRTASKKPVENKELWKELYELKNQFNDIVFTKCKGHADNEGNNKADELANEAMGEIE